MFLLCFAGRDLCEVVGEVAQGIDNLACLFHAFAEGDSQDTIQAAIFLILVFAVQSALDEGGIRVCIYFERCVHETFRHEGPTVIDDMAEWLGLHIVYAVGARVCLNQVRSRQHAVHV